MVCADSGKFSVLKGELSRAARPVLLWKMSQYQHIFCNLFSFLDAAMIDSITVRRGITTSASAAKKRAHVSFRVSQRMLPHLPSIRVVQAEVVASILPSVEASRKSV